MAILLSSCKTSKPLQTVAKLDVGKYSGLWYEIARLPNSFEKGLDCVTAEYTLSSDNKIIVVNKGRKFTKDKTFSEIKGRAWVPDRDFPGQLKVRFFWPFAGDYWVFFLSDDYQTAMVGTKSRKFFWLLSRNNAIDQKAYDSLITIAAENGFDVMKIEKINQDCQ